MNVKTIPTVLVIGLLLLTSMLAPVNSGALNQIEGAGIGISPSTEENAYASFSRDSDHNGIDDLLEDGARDSVDVFVRFDRPITNDDLMRLKPFGHVSYVDPNIHVATMEGVDGRDVENIILLPGVTLVEKQIPLVPMLEISAPAIRATASSTYSHGARELGYNGSGVTIAVFDTGVDNSIHDSLDDLDDDDGTNDPKYVAGIDATGTVVRETDPNDTDGHGTHVAGISMGTGGSNDTYEGIAPQANLVDVKVLPTVGSGQPNKFLQALTWCRNNMEEYDIRILTMSLGTQGTSSGDDTLSIAINNAVNNDGLIVVAAMGNDGPSNSGIPAPAAADEAIAVGAYDDLDTVTRSDDSISSFSNRGPRESDGDEDEIDELKPEISAPGAGIMSAMANTPGTYREASGTSQAAPHVTGIVALMLQANPDLSPEDVRTILQDTAQSRGSVHDSDLSMKYNTGFGWGMIDGYGAVKRAEDLKKKGLLAGAPTVGKGSSASFTARTTFTRTEFENTPVNASFNITVPDSWGKPSNIVVNVTGPLEYDPGHSEPVVINDNWTFTGWAEMTGPVDSPTQIIPSVSFTSFAPMDKGDYDLAMRVFLNGVPGKRDLHQVTVVEDSGGKADLYLERSDISFSIEQPVTGQLVTIQATVHNGGTLGANANVSFFDGPPETGIPLGTDTVSVPSSGTDDATAVWLATPGTHYIHVVVDLDEVVPETDEDNNEANRSISVTGFNNPPTASLVVEPSEVGEGGEVFFDGSDSSDVDGIVVLYNFFFGDGNSSGWIASPNTTHAYSEQGHYIATLQVRDNGGAQSTNDPEEMITVKELETKKRSMYLHADHELLFKPPDEDMALEEDLPNGFTPISPGSPFGTVESKEVGTWSSTPFTETNSLGGEATYHIWVNNTGDQDIEVSNFTFNLEIDDQVIDSSEATEPGVLEPGTPVGIEVTTFLEDVEVPEDSRIHLNIWCAIDGDGGTLEYGSMERDSGMDLSFTSFKGLPPTVDAGENKTVQVNETVEFIPDASDEDGHIINFEWDFDTDGEWDYVSSSTGVTTHIYERTGEYLATIRVTDNDGDTATDNLNVTVTRGNRKPIIRDPEPSSPVSVDEGSSITFSIDPDDPDGDALDIQWSVDGGLRASTGVSYVYSPIDTDVGTHIVRVTVSDGQASVEHSWDVTVLPVNHRPSIDDYTPTVQTVVISEGETMQFSVEASDVDDDPLSYRWTVDGLMNGNKASYIYISDRDSVGIHTVTITVSDGELETSFNWTLQVLGQNTDPVLRYMIPREGDRFRTDQAIFFEVDAYDPDDDDLEYTWTSSIDGQIGTEKSFSLRLSNGTHEITVTITDGNGGHVSDDVTITVEPARGGEEEDSTGLWIIVGGLGIVAAVLALLFFMERRRSRLAAERAERERELERKRRAHRAKRRKAAKKKARTRSKGGKKKKARTRNKGGKKKKARTRNKGGKKKKARTKKRPGGAKGKGTTKKKRVAKTGKKKRRVRASDKRKGKRAPGSPARRTGKDGNLLEHAKKEEEELIEEMFD